MNETGPFPPNTIEQPQCALPAFEEASEEPASPPRATPSHSDELIAELQRDIMVKTRLLVWIEKRRATLDSLPDRPFVFEQQIDFNSLPHTQVVDVIKAFGGKWDKSISSGGERVDYNTVCDGVAVRCWNGEPPPSCKIVEEEVEVAAVPAHKKMVRKLVCTDASQSV